MFKQRHCNQTDRHFAKGNIRLNARQQQVVERRERRILLSRQRREARLQLYRRAFPRWLPLSWSSESSLVCLLVSWFQQAFAESRKRISLQHPAAPLRNHLVFALENLEDRQMLSAVTVGIATDVTDGVTTDIAALIADPGADGQISLREAVTAANNTAGADTITFASGVGEAFAAGGVIRLTQGEIEITEALTIDGSSAPLVLITGDKNDNDQTLSGTDITDVTVSLGTDVIADGIDNDGDSTTDEGDEDLLDDNSRIFNITNASAATELIGLTLSGGRTAADNANFSDNTNSGGAIRSLGAVTLTGSTLSGNSTAGSFARGGGLYAYGYATLTNSIVLGNVTNYAFVFNDEIMRGTFSFNGNNIVGADSTAFDTTGLTNVQNADPRDVFAITTATLADVDADGTPEALTGVLGGVLALNGGGGAHHRPQRERWQSRSRCRPGRSA